MLFLNSFLTRTKFSKISFISLFFVLIIKRLLFRSTIGPTVHFLNTVSSWLSDIIKGKFLSLTMHIEIYMGGADFGKDVVFCKHLKPSFYRQQKHPPFPHCFFYLYDQWPACWYWIWSEASWPVYVAYNLNDILRYT